jgi:acyl-CoA synthetase (NDP forming)
VIVMKGGRGQAGSRMTMSHTASMAGSFQVWEAMIRQAGAVSANNFDELIDLAVSFNFLPPMRGKRAGVIGGGGGPSVIAAEECEEAGLEVIPIPQDMREEMRDRGVAIWDWITNPVDVSIVGDSGITDIDMLHLMGKHPDFDLLMVNFNEWVLITLALEERFSQRMEAQVKNHIEIRDKYGKPFVVVIGERGAAADPYDDRYGKVIAEARSELINAGMATYPTFTRAASAISKVQAYYSRFA